FFNWFFYYLVEVRGFAAEEAAGLSAAQWMVGTVGALAGGWACDASMRRYGLRWGARLVPVAGMLLAAALLVSGARAGSPLQAVVLLAACFGCVQATDAAYWAATIAVGDRHAASATGILNTGGNLVGSVSALLVPILARGLGWYWAIASGSAAALLAAGLWLAIRCDRPLRIPAARSPAGEAPPRTDE
ncbi:MAG: hypothetical protein R3190_14765, partial [Thermoanaerobaculia bacterium]|nr:hypothetical protein [Thermoanaerobaculia bacterium]